MRSFQQVLDYRLEGEDMVRKLGIPLSLALAGTLVAAGPALAHWCNNIWSAPSRMVVKPETSTVYLSGSSSSKLRVYLRNNFPQTLFGLNMRGSASGYTITVSPSSHTARPGQNVSFLLTITPKGGSTGNVNVTNLGLQVRFRSSSGFYGWQDGNDCRVDQTPSQSLLRARSVYGTKGSGNNCGNNQSASLSAATLADLFPSATLATGQPTFGRTGLQQVINFFGYRFCYSSGGGWRSGGSNCPNPSAEGSAWSSIQQFGQNCMRAGVELAVRKTQLGSNLQAAQNAAINAMKGGSDEHKCLAAVVGAYLWRGASSTAAFTAGLGPLSQRCKNAATRALSGGAAVSCGSGWPYYERAACAAAEGLRNNNGPVTSILIPRAGDGKKPPAPDGYETLYNAYMLRIVAAYREATTGTIPFYPDAGAPTTDMGTQPADKGVPPPVDKGAPPPADKGTPVTDGPLVDGPLADGSKPTVDAASVDGGKPTADVGRPGDGESGEWDDGCHVASSPASGPWIGLFLALTLWWRRRRRP